MPGMARNNGTQRRKTMLNFDFRAASSYAAATAVTLFATTMLFAATAVPSVSNAVGVIV